MTKPYLEDRNGKKYEFRRLTRREDCKLMDMQRNMDTDDTTSIMEETIWFLFNVVHPEVSKEDFVDILDYTYDEYGREIYIELLSSIANDSFQSAGGKKHPYLEEKKIQALKNKK